MPKNIVVCFDDLYWTQSSNVVRLYRTLSQDLESQVTYYDPSVGAMEPHRPMKLFKRFLGLAYGVGLFEELGSAYNFLMRTYEQGDRLFFFGVGRGAYTARTLAGILHLSGLIRPGSEALIPYAIGISAKLDNETFETAKEFKETFSRECPVHFVGVWETPAQFGWILSPFPLRIPFSANNPGIQIGRQAIAMDERRVLFQPSLWRPLAPPLPAGPRDLKQVWFRGVHSDVCGGYPELDSGISKISLQWMLTEAIQNGLLVNPNKMQDVLGLNDSTTTPPPDPSAPIHDSLRGVWWLWEFVPIKYFDLKTERMRFEVHLGRRRLIPEGALIHQSALERSGGYPHQLPKHYLVEPGQPPSAAEGSPH
jgi:uncharacterized protein (DUF2235 family)